MKKSVQVPATLIIALAANLANQGCGSDQTCEDRFGRVLPDSNCQGGMYTGSGVHWVQTGGFGGGGYGGGYGG